MTKDLRLIFRNYKDESVIFSSTTWSEDREPTKEEYDQITKAVCIDKGHDPSYVKIWSAQMFTQL